MITYLIIWVLLIALGICFLLLEDVCNNGIGVPGIIILIVCFAWATWSVYLAAPQILKIIF